MAYSRPAGGLKFVPCPNSSAFNQRHKFGFSKDADLLACRNELICSPVFGALLMAIEQRQVLVTNNQQGHLLAYAGLHRDSRARCASSCFCPGHGHLTGEASYMAKKRSILVPFQGDALCVVRFVFRSLVTLGELFVVFSSFLLRQEHNLSSGLGVFSSIMVVKVKVEMRFQACEAVASIAFQFRPSLSSNRHTVMPMAFRIWQSIPSTGTFDCSLVKAAVLHQGVSLEEGPQRLNNLAKVRLATDRCRVDTMQVHVEFVEVGLRVNQKADGLNKALIRHQGEADLTNRRCVRVGSFHIYGDKAECLIEKVRVRSRYRPFYIFFRSNRGTLLSSRLSVGLWLMILPTERGVQLMQGGSATFVFLARAKGKEKADYYSENENNNFQLRIPFVVCLVTAKGAGNWGGGQALVVCQNAAGREGLSPVTGADWGPTHLQAAPISSPVGPGRVADALPCALFPAGAVRRSSIVQNGTGVEQWVGQRCPRPPARRSGSCQRMCRRNRNRSVSLTVWCKAGRNNIKRRAVQ